MARSSRDATKRKLRDALVVEVVENGISSVNIARIVERAKVSAGTVYVHFENKDDMLRQVYMELKAELRIPEHPAGHSDSIRPPKPGYLATLV